MARLQRRSKVPLSSSTIGDAAAHAGGEIAAGLAEHDDDAAGHVFAAMRADALDDGESARVAHGEALAGDAAEDSIRRSIAP